MLIRQQIFFFGRKQFQVAEKGPYCFLSNKRIQECFYPVQYTRLHADKWTWNEAVGGRELQWTLFKDLSTTQCLLQGFEHYVVAFVEYYKSFNAELLCYTVFHSIFKILQKGRVHRIIPLFLITRQHRKNSIGLPFFWQQPHILCCIQFWPLLALSDIVAYVLAFYQDILVCNNIWAFCEFQSCMNLLSQIVTDYLQVYICNSSIRLNFNSIFSMNITVEIL